jgi:5'-methylthioadenosine phosphorylase
MHGIKIGLIGGSGMGEALLRQTDGRRHEVDTPFGRPSDAIIETEWAGLPVYFLSRHGPGHVLNPSQVPYRANLFALKTLGVTHIIASGAVGSLREEFRPRDLVIPEQVIDKTHKRANTFFEKAAVHVELSEPFCPVLRRTIVEVAKEGSGERVQGSGGNTEGTTGGEAEPVAEEGNSAPEPRTLNPEPYTVHDRGCYVCMEGPAFSTRAESLMHRLWGGDLIGMTAMPEAKLAREAEISYALVALVTDYDCWRRPPAGSVVRVQGSGSAAATASSPEPRTPNPEPSQDPYVLLKEIIANLQAASDNAIALIRRTVQRIAERGEELGLANAPAREALKLAIWSDKSQIPADEVERLGPLWMKYFER